MLFINFFYKLFYLHYYITIFTLRYIYIYTNDESDAHQEVGIQSFFNSKSSPLIPPSYSHYEKSAP